LSLKKDRFNIVILHGDIHQGENRNGESVSLRRLQNNHIDYLALGHIHIPTLTAERLDSRGTYRYCGCLEGRGFDERGKRGFFLLEVIDGKLQSETFLSLAKREIVEIRVDISACNTYYDVERTAFTALQNVKRENMVRLVLIGQHAVGIRKDLSLLSHRLCEHFFFVKVSDESRVFIDYSAFANDLSERGEFVREVGRYEMNEEIRAEIIDVGLKALLGEEIDL
jgi:DNA repair exonuclease SbcCD nuclease subunit